MKKSAVPDAWDDDWEAQADRASKEEDEESHQGGASLQQPLTKAERITQHEESNRKMWQSADATPQTFHYLEANSNVPLTTNFKPQVKVLSRKPVLARRDPATGMSHLTIDDDDSTEKKAPQLTPEEIRAKQRRDLEERQRRYDEARAKIFGESAPSSRGSSPGTGTVTPPRSDSRHSGQGRGRGRGGGGSRGNNSNNNFSDGRQADARRQNNQSAAARELYDPAYMQRPDSMSQRRGAGGSGAGDSDHSGRGTPIREELQQQQQQAIRAPRGPDGSGRGGFGFARRGAKES